MSTATKAIFFLFVVTTLSGCATPRMNLSTPIDQNPAAKNDKALLYFLRPEMLGFKIHAAVYDGDEFIGFVPYNQKLPYFAEPGEHLFMVVSEAADFMKADLLPGRTYYVQVVPRMGAWRARFSLSPYTQDQLDSDNFKKIASESRLIKNNEKAYQWDRNNRQSVLQKKQAYLKKWLSKDAPKRPYLKPTDSH